MQHTGSICDVPGIKVGHAQNEQGKTGCTVIIPHNGAVAGMDIRGSAPGTREVETLRPVRLVPKIHAILLTGGSAFGLDASGGVQQFLEERGIGYDVGITKVPIVPAAVIFDLREGDSKIRPDKQMGYAAALAASSRPPKEGQVGVGTGATIGKAAGYQYRMNGGVGTNATKLGEICVGCLVVVNAFGDVVDPASGRIVAGAKDPESGEFINCEQFLKTQAIEPFPIEPFRAVTNTTLAVVATDAAFTKEEAIKVAEMAQDGLSRATRPAHTPYDGDLVFALSVGQKRGNVTTIGTVAAELVADAIVRAVKIANHLT
jgi:L-aminopeptidase/D-esterase-like protein